MKRFLGAASILAASATASLAQDPDWTGAYGGLTAAHSTGFHDYSPDFGPSGNYDIEGPSFGGFFGYMWGKGNLVYGAELAAVLSGVYETDVDGTNPWFSYNNEYEYHHFVDLKGRFGYATGRFLVYGTLGASWARFDANIGEPDQVNSNVSGLAYGVGADYRLTDRMFVGAEYLRRNYGFHEAQQDVDIDARIDTITLRLGMKF